MLGRRKDVPLILQNSNAECGAACLAMVLGYHGRKTAISELHDCISTGRDGVRASALSRAAREKGLRTRSFSGEPEHFPVLPLPAIVHWEFKHYIVVERWSPTEVTVVDPAMGRRTLTSEEFDAGFTGIIMIFEPGVDFERKRPTRDDNPWRVYLDYMLSLSGIRRILLQILGASLLLQLLGLAVPIATKVIVDDILPFKLESLLGIMALGLGVIVVMLAVTTFLRHALFIYLQTRLDSQMMLGFFEHLLNLPLPFFQGRSTGDLIMRLNSNAIIREVLTNQTLAAVLDGSLVVIYLLILLVQAPIFGVIVFVLGAIQIAIPLMLAPRIRVLLQEGLKADGASQGYLVEALGSIITLKASGAESHALERWSNLFFERLNLAVQRSYLTAMIQTSSRILGTLAPLALLFVGAQLVLDEQLSLGTMLALNALGVAALAPLSTLVNVIQQLQFGGAHLARLFDVLLTEPEQEAGVERRKPELHGGIEVRDVSFRYNPQTRYVLENISVSFEPGQKIAIVGPTGSGKTTLGMLLLGLYPPTEGEIFFDDHRLDELDYKHLRSQFGIVLQDSSLFSGSVRQNIALTRPDTPLGEIEEAARRAAVHDEISDMPMGYETMVAEKGSSISGGQLQRIALARALLHDPKILLLDEATSHLDVLTEQRIEETLSSMRCTRIVIAHRLSTVRDADVILMLEKGKIRERGTHQELLERGGRYAELVGRQLEEAQQT